MKNNKIRRDFKVNNKAMHTNNKIKAKKVQLKTKITCHYNTSRNVGKTKPLRAFIKQSVDEQFKFQ